MNDDVTMNSRSTRRGAAAALAVLVFAVMEVWLSGQSESAGQKVRLNPMVAQLEQGKATVSGDEWTMIDVEHSPFDATKLEATLAGVLEKRKPNGQMSVAPLVRIPMEGDEDFRWAVKRVLDMGAMGIIFPHIETKEQAMKAIQAMRYPPQRGTKYPTPTGARGWSPQRAVKLWGMPQTEYLQRADIWPLNPQGELVALMMIETAEGVKNVSQILEVPGITSTFIGPNDLGVSLGVGPRGQDYAPETEAAIQTVLKACNAKKVNCGVAALGGEPDLKKRLSEGWKVILASGRR